MSSCSGPNGDGKLRDLACLDLDSLPMWLATIESTRVAEQVRPKLELYQRECVRVLADAFLGPRRPVPVATPLLPSDIEAMIARAVRLALAAREAHGGLIGAGRADRLILSEVRTIATIRAQRGSKAWRGEHRRIQNELRDLPGVGHRGAWRDLPERHLGDIRSKLAILRQAAERSGGPQLKLLPGPTEG